MADRLEFFKSFVRFVPTKVYKTTIFPDGHFEVDGVENLQDRLLYVADNIGSFITPRLIEFDLYFLELNLDYGRFVFNFDSSSMTWKLIDRESKIGGEENENDISM